MCILVQKFSLNHWFYSFYTMIFLSVRIFLCCLILTAYPIICVADYFHRESLEQIGLVNLDAELSYFEYPDAQPPGTYNVEIYVNDRYFGARNIDFNLNHEGQLYPNIPITLLDKIDVDISALPLLAKRPKSSYVYKIEECIPGATSYFDFSAQHLYLSIPERVLRKEESYSNMKMTILSIIDKLISR